MKQCSKIGKCGGCLNKDLEYNTLKNAKQNQVKNIIINTLIENKLEYNNITFEDIISSPKIYKYRNKMEFSFGDEIKNGPITLGMHQKKSFYNILNANECDLIEDDIKQIVDLNLEFFNKIKQNQIDYYHKKTHKGYLRYLVVRRSEYYKNLLINIVTSSQLENENILLNEYKNFILENFKYNDDFVFDNKYSQYKINIIHTHNDDFSDAVKINDIDILYGNDYIYDKISNLIFKIYPFSFFQVNSLATELLYKKIKEFIGNANIIYDLYSGMGTISQIVSNICEKVISVELVEQSIKSAYENIKLNNIKNIEFFNMNVDDFLSMYNIDNDINNCIILDPPRNGISNKSLIKILSSNVNRIVYVSCKIESLTRDLNMFYDSGYKISNICSVDMFPWTNNVETIVLFNKIL